MADSHLVVVPHTHWDREWYRTHEDFRSRLVQLLDGLLDLLESDPSFCHFTLDGQTIVLDDYLAVRPRARERIAALVRSGRLLIGPWFVLPDEWLVSGEALIRNLRRGLADAEEYGAAMPLGYVPDQFGHVGQLPQIFTGFGFETAALWRGVGDGIDDVAFTWEAPNGSRIFTLYLRSGYGNGVDLPLDPDELGDRIAREIGSQRERSTFASVLLMNGSDHRAPQPGLPVALAAAAGKLGGIDCRIGTLPEYAERARAEAPASLAVHRGELRSGLRAPLLEGCASSRMPQKYADFANDRLLTRYLEPLAAWLSGLGGEADVERLEFAWRVALENHPHDSICGCSIDAVHQEMDVRFARTTEIATGHLRHVATRLGARVAAPGGRARGRTQGSLIVWNPNSGGRSRAEGSVELDLPSGARRAPVLHVRDAHGKRIPVDAEVVAPGASFAEYDVAASIAAVMLRGFPGEFFGRQVCGIAWSRHRGRRVLDVLMGDEPPLDFDFAASKSAALEELRALGDQSIAYRVRQLARVALQFVDDLPGWGLRRYAIGRGRAGSADATPRLRAERSSDGGASIENEVWCIDAGADGSIGWRDRRTGALTHDALSLCSEGDRGDTYSFDPVPDEVPATLPTRARIVQAVASEASARVVLDLTYRVPAELCADRSARSERRVAIPARVELRLYPGLDRIDLRVELDNRARDHRLRLLIRAPFAADRFEVESAFEVAERPIAPARDAFGSPTPAEFPIGATPQRRFATIANGSEAMTLANRGAAEVEAIPQADGSTVLALTVLRAVGWLSRADLALRPGHAGPPLPTPGAQVPGQHRIEASVRVHRDGEPERTAEAHRFAYAPLGFAGGGSATGPLEDGARLIECADPVLVVSAVEPRADGPPLVRLYNASAEPRSAPIRHAFPGSGGFERVDLRGRSRAGADAVIASGAPIAFGPWEIVTLRPR